MKKYEFLEHPGDIKVRSFGESLPELFINTALGMMDFLYGKPKIIPTHTDHLSVDAEDLDALLVNWLSEILWLSDTNNRVYTDYHIIEFSDKKITATLQSGEATAKDDIKAVTYHELDIHKTETGWTATVVYDI